MAKDPAFLFYTSDFLTGTMFMNNEQVGKYIRLLCAQHQHNGIIDKLAFDHIAGSDKMLRSKFKETEQGFFNERLSEEMAKRKQKSIKLSANAKQKHSKSNAIAKQIENENESVNEDINEVEGVQGETFENIGKPNGHRITIKAKYLHERPKIVHDLQEYFRRTDQLEAIQMAGWIDFEGFMKANPGRMFAEDSEVYHSFKKHCNREIEPLKKKKVAFTI